MNNDKTGLYKATNAKRKIKLVTTSFFPSLLLVGSILLPSSEVLASNAQAKTTDVQSGESLSHLVKHKKNHKKKYNKRDKKQNKYTSSDSGSDDDGDGDSDSSLSCDVEVSDSAQLHDALTGVNPNVVPGSTICLSDTTFKPFVPFVFDDPIPGDGMPPGDVVGGRFSTFRVTVDNLTLVGDGKDKTLISGDIGAVGDPSDNAYNVVNVDFTQVTKLTVKNLTIQDGNANDLVAGAIAGAGILFIFPQPGSELHLINVNMMNNQAFFVGGAVLFEDISEFIGLPLIPPAVQHKAIIIDSDFSNNSTFVGSGGAIKAGYTNFTVSNSTFTGNSGTVGALDIVEGSANISDCVFMGNFAGDAGGGLRILNFDASLQLGDSVLDNNVFDGNTVPPGGSAIGGAVLVEGYANPNSKVRFTNNEFKNNFSFTSAGGVFVLNANAEINGNLFENNASFFTGAAIDVASSPLEFRGGTSGQQVLISHNHFESNNVQGRGGAININDTYKHLGQQPNTTILENMFINNQAADGGAIFSSGIKTVVKKNHFESNVAQGQNFATGGPAGRGGAIAVSSVARHVGRHQFFDPVYNQGELLDFVATIVIEDSVFLNNFALLDGGAIADAGIEDPLFFPGPSGESFVTMGTYLGEVTSVTGPGFADITVQDSEFTNNTAANGVGGAIAVIGQGQCEVYDLVKTISDFSEPYTAVPPYFFPAPIVTPYFLPWLPACIDDADKIFSTLSVTDSEFEDNVATDGGGIYVNDSSDVLAFPENDFVGNLPNHCNFSNPTCEEDDSDSADTSDGISDDSSSD